MGSYLTRLGIYTRCKWCLTCESRSSSWIDECQQCYVGLAEFAPCCCARRVSTSNSRRNKVRRSSYLLSSCCQVTLLRSEPLAYSYRNVDSNIINKQTWQTRSSSFWNHQSLVHDLRSGRGNKRNVTSDSSFSVRSRTVGLVWVPELCKGGHILTSS